MPSAPPTIFTPPTGSSPSAPPEVFEPVVGGGAPDAPPEVFSPITGESSPSAPPVIFDPEPTFTANYLETAFDGTNNDLRFEQANPAVIPSIRFAKAPSLVGIPFVVVTGSQITITLATVSGNSAYQTAAQVKAAIDGNAEALALVSVAYKTGNDGTGVICQPATTDISFGPTALAGGDAITAPPEVFEPITGGSSPSAPPEVFEPITGESSPSAPPEVFEPVTGGSSPAAPPVVFTAPSDESPGLPPMIFGVEETAMLDAMQTITDGGEQLTD